MAHQVQKGGKIIYVTKIGGTPLGIQKFDGVPFRRFLNKSKFYGFRLRSLKQNMFFSAN